MPFLIKTVRHVIIEIHEFIRKAFLAENFGNHNKI